MLKGTCLCMGMCTRGQVPAEARDGVRSPGDAVICSCEPPDMGTLEELDMLLTTGPRHQHSNRRPSDVSDRTALCGSSVTSGPQHLFCRPELLEGL